MRLYCGNLELTCFVHIDWEQLGGEGSRLSQKCAKSAHDFPIQKPSASAAWGRIGVSASSQSTFLT